MKRSIGPKAQKYDRMGKKRKKKEKEDSTCVNLHILRVSNCAAGVLAVAQLDDNKACDAVTV